MDFLVSYRRFDSTKAVPLPPKHRQYISITSIMLHMRRINWFMNFLPLKLRWFFINDDGGGETPLVMMGNRMVHTFATLWINYGINGSIYWYFIDDQWYLTDTKHIRAAILNDKWKYSLFFLFKYMEYVCHIRGTLIFAVN